MNIESWHDLKLSPNVRKAIDEFGFRSVTPVQKVCIPLFLKKKDVAVEAITGSGKTLAFLVPLLEILLTKSPFLGKDIAALIVSPTQELAIQIHEVLKIFLKYVTEFSSLLLIGGEPLAIAMQKLDKEGGNIIVATPGRFVDLISRKYESFQITQRLKSLEILILDEADKLLELGFESSLNTILGVLPKQRITGLFSATQTNDVEDLIRAGLRNPVCITVKEKGAQDTQRTPSTLSNFYMITEPEKKFNVLLEFLRLHSGEKIMLFFATCASVDYFTSVLTKLLKHSSILSIHGKMSKKAKRHKMFLQFKTMTSGILLCTDVMARGVDILDVNWVIQYDPPSSASDFVHRCGRTARIGKTGNALVILLPNEETFVDFLTVNQKVMLDKMECPEATDFTPKIRQLVSTHREIYEKSMRAFVSYIRFYTKHECNLLFRLKDLDLGKLAMGFSLLKLPRMPELKGKLSHNFDPISIDVDNIPYKNKHREKERQIKLKEFKNNPELMKKKLIQKKDESWSKSKRLKSRKLQMKKGKKRKHHYSNDDLEELARDARLLKKLKQKRISEAEFDAQFAPDNNLEQ